MVLEPITQMWIEQLLEMPTEQQQSAFLHTADLLSQAGLERLLDETEQLVRRNPGQAHQLAALCERVASAHRLHTIVPRALYLRAQALAIHGELQDALHLIQEAQHQFAALEMQVDALRTNVGRINVLIQLGRFQDGLDVAQQVRTQLEALAPQARADADELILLKALIAVSSGTAYGEMGRYEEAIDAYAQAEAIYSKLHMPERLAVVISNRGLILRYLGRMSEALAVYEEALSLEQTSDYAQGLMLINIGEAHLLLGRYTQGLDSFRRAAGLLAKVEAISDQHANLLHMADAYRMLNLYPEALTAYREAETNFAQTNLIYERAMALWGIGSTLAAQKLLSQAAEPLAKAAALFTEAGNRPLRSSVLLEQAALKASEGHRESALELAQQALQLVSDPQQTEEQWPVQMVYAHLRLADLLLPHLEEAESHLTSASGLLDGLTLPHLRYRLHQRLGHIRLRQGQLDAAEELLENALQEIEAQRTLLTHETMRSSFLHDKTAAYADLVQVHLARAQREPGAAAQPELEIRRAFETVERAKSRALAESISSGSQDANHQATVSRETERLQLLQADLSAVYSEMLTTDGEQHEIGNSVERVAKLNARALALEQEISLLRLQAPAQASPVCLQRGPISVDQLCASLPPQGVLLSYYIFNTKICLFVVTVRGVEFIDNVGSVAQVEQLLQKLNAQWDRFRAGAEFVQRHMPILERTANHILGQLYQILVAPVEPLLSRLSPPDDGAATPLVIVPHGLLHQAPFHAFYDGARHLVERFDLSYAPSTTIWHMCQQRPLRTTDQPLIMGAPDANIPAVEREVQSVAHHFPAARVYVGAQATRAALLRAAGTAGLLHLACHGLFRADNPLFSALKLADGWLNAAELAQLDLRGAQVVFSACESGRSRVLGGDELIGLARAALSAGASTLLVSQWLVHDDTGARLMGVWYEKLLGGQTPSAALRLAQLTIKRTQPHPYYWAAFVAMGRG